MKARKPTLRATLAVAILALLSGTAGATLIDRGGGLIYDTDLDITWLQDASYARTSGYDSDGLMNFQEAMAWADQLSFGGYDDWRLPLGFPQGDSYINQFSYDGNSDWGFNLAPATERRNEMAYLFYVELGNLAKYDIQGNQRAAGTYGLQNTGPFDNLAMDTEAYWTGTKIAGGRALRFSFSDAGRGGASGLKGRDYTSYEFNAWAVRDGDVVAMPEPSVAALFGVGLLSLLAASRRGSRAGEEASRKG